MSGTASSAPAAPRIHAQASTDRNTTSGAEVELGAHHDRLQEVVLGEVDQRVADDDGHRRHDAAAEQREDRRRDDRDERADVRDERGREHEERPQERERHVEDPQEDRRQDRGEHAQLRPDEQVLAQVGAELLDPRQELALGAERRLGACLERAAAGERVDHREREDEQPEAGRRRGRRDRPQPRRAPGSPRRPT